MFTTELYGYGLSAGVFATLRDGLNFPAGDRSKCLIEKAEANQTSVNISVMYFLTTVLVVGTYKNTTRQPILH